MEEDEKKKEEEVQQKTELHSDSEKGIEPNDEDSQNIEKKDKKFPRSPKDRENNKPLSITEDKKESTTSIETTVGKIDAQNVEIAKDIRKYFIQGAETFRIKKFSISNSLILSKDTISSVKNVYVYPKLEIERLISLLKLNRILIITGKPESGKCFTSQYLAYQFLKTKKINQVRIVRTISREINIDIDELVNSNSLKGKFIIFRDAFADGNLDLFNFLKMFAEDTEIFFKKMKETNAYIVFTADHNTIKDYDFILSNLRIHFKISSLPEELLTKGLEHKLKHFCSLNKKNWKKIYEKLIREDPDIVNKLGRMSKIVLFVENYLNKVIAGEKAIYEAIDEVNNIDKQVEYWFLRDLAKDSKEFESWTFALCLALFHGISWFSFEKLHKEITRILIDELNPFGSKEKLTFKLSEDHLLNLCKAQITKDIQTGADVIEFCDPNYSDILLNVILKHSRKPLACLIPYLESLAEDQYQQDHRRLAAFNLARIGEIDPDLITFRLIRKWSKMQEPFHRATVGYLYEGILKSRDENYRKYSLNFLRNLALSKDTYEQWTAIATYKQIGIQNLELSMQELRKIEEKILERLVSYETLNEIFQQSYGDINEAIQSLNILYEKTEYLLSTIRYSIVALCILNEPIEVISQLRKWIIDGKPISEVIVVLFFLGPDGIAEVLENRENLYMYDEDDDETNQLKNENRLISSLTTGQESINRMVNFLRDLYNCFTRFPANLQPFLKENFFNHLKRWSLEAVSHNRLSSNMQNVLIGLYESGDDELKETIWHSINQWTSAKNHSLFDEFLKGVVDEIV